MCARMFNTCTDEIFSMFIEFEDPNDGNSSSDMEEYGWDDSDIDVDDQPPVVQTEKRKQSVKSAGGPSVQDYMDLMDRELSQTSVGKSFEKDPIVKEQASEPKPPQVKIMAILYTCILNFHVCKKLDLVF